MMTLTPMTPITAAADPHQAPSATAAALGNETVLALPIYDEISFY